VTATYHGERRRKTDGATSYHDGIDVFHVNEPPSTNEPTTHQFRSVDVNAQTKYDPGNKAALWGAYNYTPDKDVVRVPMKVETLPFAVDQLTWTFLDMTPDSGRVAIMWGKTMASAPFKASAAQ